MSPFENFLERLAYFGGNIYTAPESVRTTYQDLEEFFIDATIFMSKDIRVTQCFLAWLSRYSILLSPSKIRRLLKTKEFDAAVLGAFISLIQETFSHTSHWNILKKYIRKEQNILLFPNLPVPKLKQNVHFKKVGIVAHSFSLSIQKYLISPESIPQRCPEIYYRTLGITPVAADLRVFLEKTISPVTAYYIAKITHHHRAQIYHFYKLMQIWGTLPKR